MNAIDLESCRFMSLINITEIDKVTGLILKSFYPTRIITKTDWCHETSHKLILWAIGKSAIQCKV